MGDRRRLPRPVPRPAPWPADIVRMVAQAATPWERITWACFRPLPRTDVERTAYRLQHWIQAVANGDAARWRTLMQERGWSVHECQRAVSPVRFDPRRHHPMWAADLRRLLDASAAEPPLVAAVAAAAPEEDREFVRLCAPLLSLPARLLARHGGMAPLSADAERTLLLQVCRRWRTVLLPLLTATVDSADVLLGRGTRMGDRLSAEWFPACGPTTLGQWRRVFARYPVAARLVAVIARAWWDATLAWRQHLAQARPGVRVAALSADAGDVHEHGRSVLIVDLDDGTRLVYKPRALHVAQALESLDDIVQAHGADACVARRARHYRADHTWDVFVPRSPCTGPAEVVAYFTRLGGLARLLEFTGATDCTTDNVMAVGAWPVLIDEETLLAPPMPAPAGTRAEARLQRGPVAEGPWQSGIVTARIDGAVGWASADLGALARPEQRDAPFPVLPGAQRGDACQRFTGNSATPVLDGVPVDPRVYWPQVQRGYVAVHAALARAAASGALAVWRRQLAGARIRVILRDTQVYDRLLRASVRPDRLVDGVQRELSLELVWRARHKDLRVGAAEQAALRDGEIPVFFAAADARALQLPQGHRVPRYFTHRATTLVRARTHALRAGPATTAAAAERLDAALFVLDPGRDAVVASVAPRARPRPWAPLREATRLLGGWLARGVVGADGSRAWFGAHYRPEHDRWRLGVLPPTVHSGLAGLAVVTSALSAADPGADAWRVLARTLAWQLHASLRDGDGWRLRPAAPWHWAWDGTHAAARMCATLLCDARLEDALADRTLRAPALPAPPPPVPAPTGTGWHRGLACLDACISEGGDSAATRAQAQALLQSLGDGTRAWPGARLPASLHACAIDGQAALAYLLLRTLSPERYPSLLTPRADRHSVVTTVRAHA